MPSGGCGRDAAKEAFWRESLEAQRQSGKSIQAFCRERGVSIASFHNWRKEIRRRDEEIARPREAQFAELRPIPEKSQCGSSCDDGAYSVSGIELVLDGGRVIRLSPGFDEGTLSRLIALLEPRPC